MKYLSPNVKIKHRVIHPAKNEVTGDVIQTRVNTDAYRDNFDAIFGIKRISEPLANHSQNVSPIDNQSK
jgi:hypothetical protein